MALLDMSLPLQNALTSSAFKIVRRQETVSTLTGRPIVTTTTINAAGVVTQDGNGLDRMADYDAGKRTIMVVTKAKIFWNVKGYKPDVVMWDGTAYVVRGLDNYSAYGAGFVQAMCSSIDHTETPISELGSQSGQIPPILPIII
jgi:hypothetical protein